MPRPDIGDRSPAVDVIHVPIAGVWVWAGDPLNGGALLAWGVIAMPFRAAARPRSGSERR